jgi:biopolymer transport protein ExbB
MPNYVLTQGGAVVWIIIAMGLAAFGVYIERSLHLHRARIRADDFLKGIKTNLKRGNVTEALSICEGTPGPVAYIVKTAILHRADPKDSIQKALYEASLSETSRMERRLVVVATVAQTAPLMGLLGTVMGMIDSLLVMQQQGVLVQAAHVTNGLLKALVATGAGLMVAIPAYVAFNLLVIKIDRLVLDMERVASEVSAFLDENRRAAGAERNG